MNGISLVNTPGYYYAIAYWLSVCLYSRFLKQKFSTPVTWSCRAAGLVILTVFMQLTRNVTQVRFVLSMAVIVVVLFLIFFLTCAENIYKCIYYCIRAFILGEFAASLEWQIYYYLMERWPKLQGQLYNFLIMAVIYAAIFSLFYLLDKRIEKEDYTFQVGWKECVNAGGMALVVFIISNLSYLYANTPFSSQFSKEVFIIRTLFDFGGVSILYAYHVSELQLQFWAESRYLHQMIDMQYANYQMAEKSIDMVNQKYHDLKHQIAILREHALDNETVVKSMDAMERDIKSYEAQNKTGNKVLDTILTSKNLYCQSLDVQLHAVIDGASLEFIDVMDLSALFGNILDNAIEGVLKVKDKEKRLIHLMVVQEKGFLRIRCENYYEGKIDFKDGLLKTTKSNQAFHGYGMKSIRSIAQKYGGSATFGAKGQWFEVRVLIPLEK